MHFRASLLALAAAALLPAGAHATTFCVGQPAGCSGQAVAANQLEAGAMHSLALGDGQPDTIVLAAGTYTDPDAFTLGAGTDPVEIVGAGPHATTLTGTSVVTGTLLDFSGTKHAVTVRKLGVLIPASWLDGFITMGIRVNGVLEDVAVISENPRSDGIEVGGTSTLRRVEVSAPVGDAVVGTCQGVDLTVTDSHLAGATALSTWGCQNPSSFDVDRTVLSATSGSITGSGLSTTYGTTKIRNSLIAIRSDGLALVSGIVAYWGSVIADHVTVVRDGGTVEKTEGVRVVTTGSTTSQVKMTHSIVSGVDVLGVRTGSQPPATGMAKVSFDHTILPAAFPAGTGNGSVTLGAGMITAADAGFVDVAASNFRLRADSPAVDAGDAAWSGSTKDIVSLARVMDGNGDGVARTDLGAYERPAPLPAPPAPVVQDGGAGDPAPAGDQPASETPVADGGAAVGGTTDVTAPATTASTSATAVATARTCRVPKLRGRTLASAKRALRRAGCKVGRVTGARSGARRVKRQRIAAGRTVPAGTAVGLVLRRTRR